MIIGIEIGLVIMNVSVMLCLNSLSFVLTLFPKHFSGIKIKEAGD